MASHRRDVVKLPHHQQHEFCTSRPGYRQGRQLTAVKVYTVNDESQHLIVSGVPALGLQDDLRRLSERFGDVRSLVYVPNYTEEDFVESYHIQYGRIQSARFGKRQMDGRAFFGGTLHVCYAPEMEAIGETRAKLTQRKRDVARRCEKSERSGRFQENHDLKLASYHNGEKPFDGYKKNPRRVHSDCIWNGKSTISDPRLVPAQELEKVSATNYGPQLPNTDWHDVGVRESKIEPYHPHTRTQLNNQQKGVRKRPFTLPTSAWMKTVLPLNPNACTASTPSPDQVPPILKLVPSQVKGGCRRIIFRHNHGLTKDQPPNTGIVTLDATIQSVRERIRAVGVPNVKLVLEKKNCKGIGPSIQDSNLTKII